MVTARMCGGLRSLYICNLLYYITPLLFFESPPVHPKTEDARDMFVPPEAFPQIIFPENYVRSLSPLPSTKTNTRSFCVPSTKILIPRRHDLPGGYNLVSVISKPANAGCMTSSSRKVAKTSKTRVQVARIYSSFFYSVSFTH
jgi:hypothetical protein